jgi:hypothetical protein
MNNQDRNRQPPELGSNPRDREAALIRSLVGAIPYIGSALSEIITALIPNQRIERVEKYLLYLQQELARLVPDNLQERIRTPAAIDLIEDGAYQAARALSDERQRYIARCVASGIAADDVDHIREKRVLGILSQLDEEEILLLDAYGSSISEGGERFERLRPPRASRPDR